MKRTMKISLVLIAIIAINNFAQDYVIDNRELGILRILTYNLACLTLPLFAFAWLSSYVKNSWLFASMIVVVAFAEYVAALESYFHGPTRESPSFAQKSVEFDNRVVFNGYRNAVGRVFVSRRVLGPVFEVTEICSNRVGKRSIQFEKVDDSHVRCFETKEGTSLVRI